MMILFQKIQISIAVLMIMITSAMIPIVVRMAVNVLEKLELISLATVSQDSVVIGVKLIYAFVHQLTVRTMVLVLKALELI